MHRHYIRFIHWVPLLALCMACGGSGNAPTRSPSEPSVKGTWISLSQLPVTPAPAKSESAARGIIDDSQVCKNGEFAWILSNDSRHLFAVARNGTVLEGKAAITLQGSEARVAISTEACRVWVVERSGKQAGAVHTYGIRDNALTDDVIQWPDATPAWLSLSVDGRAAWVYFEPRRPEVEMKLRLAYVTADASSKLSTSGFITAHGEPDMAYLVPARTPGLAWLLHAVGSREKGSFQEKPCSAEVHLLDAISSNPAQKTKELKDGFCIFESPATRPLRVGSILGVLGTKGVWLDERADVIPGFSVCLLNRVSPRALKRSGTAAPGWIPCERGLVFVDSTPRVVTVPPLLPTEEVTWLVGIPGKQETWAATNAGQLYRIDSNFQVSEPFPLDGKELKGLVRSSNGDHLWLSTQSGLALHQASNPKAAPRRFFPGKDLLMVAPINQGSLMLVETEQLETYLIDPSMDSALPVFNKLPVSLGAISDGQNSWIRSGDALFTFGSRDAQASVVLGKTTLTMKSRGPVVIEAEPFVSNPSLGKARVNLGWPGSQQVGNYPGSVKLELRTRDSNGDVVKTPIGQPQPFAKDVEFDFAGTVKEWDTPHELVVTYWDSLGTNLTWTWPVVTFRLPLLSRPWFRTVVVAAVLLLLMGVLFALHQVPLVGRWLGLFFVGTGGLTSFNLHERLMKSELIDGRLLVSMLVVGMFAYGALGLVSLPMFRLLAQVAPFQWFAPWALSLRLVRRQLLRQQHKEISDWLETERIHSNQEKYVQLPADLRTEDSSDTKVTAEPAEYIWRKLVGLPAGAAGQAGPLYALFGGAAQRGAAGQKRETHALPRASVLIQSPGGRGKSALLRRVIELALEEWAQDPSSPLPVIVRPNIKASLTGDVSDEQALLELLKTTLGGNVITPELLKVQLMQGHFILIIDGITESEIDIRSFEQLVRGCRGNETRLLVTARPNEAYRRALMQAESWSVLTPRPLDWASLNAFVEAYAKEHPKRSQLPANLVEQLGERWKTEEKKEQSTYMPILVRLAVQVAAEPEEDSQSSSVAGLYERVFLSLMKKKSEAMHSEEDSQSIWDSAKLCLKTYWETGNRALAVQTFSNEKEAELLRKLRAAGILIPQEGPTARFFHDSMQSYLTAKALCAAAPPHFLAESIARPNLRREGEFEVFRMCRHVLGPGLFGSQLQEELNHWIEDDTTYRKEDILAAADDELRSQLTEDPAYKTDRLGALLKKAYESCKKRDGGQLGGTLARKLFLGLAPCAWRLAKAPPPQQQAPAALA